MAWREQVTSGAIGSLATAIAVVIKGAFASYSEKKKADTALAVSEADKAESHAKIVVARSETEEITAVHSLRFAERQQQRADEKAEQVMQKTEQLYDCRLELERTRHDLKNTKHVLATVIERVETLEKEHANCPGRKSNPPGKPSFLQT